MPPLGTPGTRSEKWVVVALGLIALAVPAGRAAHAGAGPGSLQDVDDDDFPRYPEGRRPFRPITDPGFLQADEVEDQVRDDELVLGVVLGGEARAYPINMLTGPSREIINDRLAGRAIAATW